MAAALFEYGLDTMIEKLNETVEDRIYAAVDVGLQQIMAQRPPTLFRRMSV